MSNTNNYAETTKQGLGTTINIPLIGHIYRDTLQGLATKMNEELSGTFNLPELDNIILVPRVSKNNGVGATEIGAFAYFTTTNPQGNIFYRGKGNSKIGGGRVNMVSAAGIASGGTGPFGTSANFDAVIKPLCRVNNNGNPILDTKAVPGQKGIAQVELDFSALLCLALGIKPNDQFDYTIMDITQIANTNNYSIVIAKFVMNEGTKKGRNSKINYNRIEQEQFRRMNGGNNDGGRRY